jgi:hypothetical protein
MAPMDREVALKKLHALAAGTAIVRKRHAKKVVAVGWGSGRIKRNRGQSPTSRKRKPKGKAR